MNEPAVALTDLDRLAERVEKAASLIQQLREDRDRVGRERDEMANRLQELERKLQGQDVSALIQEHSSLKRDQQAWQVERREVASRIETLLRKLERLESSS